jgi:hypothetical protein
MSVTQVLQDARKVSNERQAEAENDYRDLVVRIANSDPVRGDKQKLIPGLVSLSIWVMCAASSAMS